MSAKTALVAMMASYFGWVFIRNGTAEKLINDAARGARDVSRGLKGPARLA